MWTEITRLKYGREKLRYASDTTDEEWSVIEPLLPPVNELGRPRTTVLRSIVDALSTGIEVSADVGIQFSLGWWVGFAGDQPERRSA